MSFLRNCRGKWKESEVLIFSIIWIDGVNICWELVW